ncbi:nuclear pore complex protein Nup85 [Diorhabda sublineata]|uniref:nuclear pore complex protein Nup85 n=1 Tax=Diorhabda sublineata TaxID=1163346 RepID=UPI0024E0736D|nr:nuclear pore complex protein Nup85 [Diorhabda sublineata]
MEFSKHPEMDKQITTFLIPNDLCKRSGIAGTWLPLDQIAVYAYEQRNVHQKDEPSHFASNSASSIFHLRQDIVLFHPILRKLVNESNGVFLSVQELVDSKTVELQVELFKISRQYRSIIRACLENLQDELTKLKDDSKNELQNYITIFYSIECIWHLCEILFIDVMPANLVLPQVLEWVRFHFPEHERNAANMLSEDIIGLEKNSEYWNTVLGALLQGRIHLVRSLLKQHSSSDSSTFRLIDQILRAMPTFSSSTGASINEYNMQWRHWTIDIQSKIDAGLFNSEQHLDLITRLIVGQEQAWIEIQDHCDVWYAYLVGWLFFTEPTVKSFELGQFAKKVITKLNMNNHLKQLDKVLLAALDFDIFQVIQEIQNMYDNGWFVSHLTDLLYHCGKLGDLQKDLPEFSPDKLRESFILDYGVTLMGHQSLWQVGLTYLDNCPSNGLQVIELLLPRIFINSEAKAQKIIREAKNRDLNNVVHSICKIQGMQSMRRGRLGNALSWALKSQDGPFTSFLADKFLHDYIRRGKLSSVDLLDNLGSGMLVSDRLIFLGKYYEFHKLYQSGEYRDAASLLISLLASKIIPKYFWYVLLIESIPLLESGDLVFSSNDTFTIIHCLEEKKDLPELKDKIEILRLAAARNLSRALIAEAEVTE